MANTAGTVLRHVAICALLLTSHQVKGSPGGAPARTCDTMKPAGPHGDPQTSEFPYRISVGRTEVNPGETLTLEIGTTGGTPFRGFLVQARRSSDPSQAMAFGVFGQPGADDTTFKTTDCFEMTANAATHTSRDDKTIVKLVWTAPTEQDTYVFMVTVLQSVETYWIGGKSEVITVGTPTGGPQPTGSTEMPPTSMPPPDLSEDALKVYESCGSTAGCYGFPANCVSSKSCTVLASWSREEGKVNFGLTAIGATGPTSYAAVGISTDSSMYDDHVIGCRGESGRAVAEEYINSPAGGQKYNMKLKTPRPTPILTLTRSSIANGHITCFFSLPEKYEMPDLNNMAIDLSTNKYFLLLARGDDADADALHKHPANGKDVSASAVDFNSHAIIGGKSAVLIKLHGSFMIFAWLVFATFGKFTARHFKNNLTNMKMFGVDIWFNLHRLCMVLAVVFSLTAGILIFVEIGGYSATGNLAQNAHPIMGILVNTLAILQVIGGLFRPDADSSTRKYFNWGHYLSGNAAWIMGVICIYLAKDLDATKLMGSKRYWVTLVIFICFHIVMHLAVSLHSALVDKDADSKLRKFIGPMQRTKSGDALPGDGLKSMFLFIYLIGSVVTGSLLTYFIVDAL